MAITHDQYLDAAIKLLPLGLAWRRSLDGYIPKILAVRCDQLVTINTTGHQLIKERLPANAELLIDEWESVYGLPDALRSVTGLTLAERQANIKDKQFERGSNNHLFLKALAARLGIEIETTNYFPHHCMRTCLYPLYEYANWWRVFITVDAELSDDEKQSLEELFAYYGYADLEFVYIYNGDA